MNTKFGNWFLFILLSFIWGSSFILMKLGLEHLSSYHVASIRILVAGLTLLPFAFRHFKDIPKQKFGVVFLSGLFGNLIPAYLFCKAEMGVSSALAGMLNSLTPIFTLILGVAFFQQKTSRMQQLGIGIAFLGSLLLLLSRGGVEGQQNLIDISLIIIATVFYGINVNMVGRYLKGINIYGVASVSLLCSGFIALLVLIFTGFFSLQFNDSGFLKAAGYTSLLGFVCTGIATVGYYQLIKNAGVIFAAMVTYCIPVMAIVWGLFYHEDITKPEIGSLFVILLGVYITNAEKIRNNYRERKIRKTL
ncbi:DMT family transporter [Taibaiella lutea]|uniref:DMT family transporter n=1 Tax=Taibaiella lutea TaxID=2608001 RepID=A0A5M6CES8_9BACT|nr:DMT family transporter [Taibaiella lutea]KAA5533674.1 DMT family transporter [Taibaiella lutea]